MSGAVTEIEDSEAALIRRINKLEKINAALMDRVERSMDVHGNAYSLFQTAINLELQVKTRTEELTNVLHRLEATNEQLRAAKEEAEQANFYKTRFLAAASHDLLQPLSAAKLSTSALMDMQETAEGTTIAGQVDRALTSIEELLKTLLDISKLDAGVMQPDVKTVALGDVFASLASDFTTIAAQKGLKFKVRPTKAHVRTDPLLLRRILQNLISNAVRYTRSGGVILGARTRRDGVVDIQVSDTGIGIPEAEHQSVFEEFRRGEGIGRAEPTGLGLGLAIVRRMSAALGHEIGFASKVDKGTTFRLTLPLVEIDPETLARPERPRLATMGLNETRVLVVDNDEAIIAASSALLTRWSCNVVTAQSPDEAVAQMRASGTPDVILADFHLDNGRTGLDVISVLRQLAGRTIPAVVITADHTQDVADAVRAADAELLNKPVRPAELRALLAHMLA
ncbi:NahK/ErcS family hybrid sensor histidine kinase/response regulator [Hartmannibacter diazotrophicus]|nr:NahK/ErcS family hybrid sensor histidine kinase/response regulator [Hartmannibacter diazotrophicus]